ncbi:hypothetical protein EDD16DRAFT_1682701 [Pisolithus croceorrhizus]|nr:hypothetical protein EDD16DRAFT_1682701 [Pisolithus croceorrhizus]KAI6107315.1 hypothetical protein EV401DRAFT_2003602 [Pisolithus croceorrhizus]KAI6140055.1 hypothetical protein EDD17DRAFT_1669809 [Pisolithus thermaeus]
MPTTMLGLALQLASDVALAKDGCTLFVMNAPQLKGRTGQPLAGRHMIECGRRVQYMLRVCPTVKVCTLTSTMTASLNTPTFPDPSGL